MAFNPSPEVSLARDYAKKFGKRRVVIFFDDGRGFGYTSYGETKPLCDSARRIGDYMFDQYKIALIAESESR